MPSGNSGMHMFKELGFFKDSLYYLGTQLLDTFTVNNRE